MAPSLPPRVDRNRRAKTEAHDRPDRMPIRAAEYQFGQPRWGSSIRRICRAVDVAGKTNLMLMGDLRAPFVAPHAFRRRNCTAHAVPGVSGSELRDEAFSPPLAGLSFQNRAVSTDWREGGRWGDRGRAA